MPETNAEIAFRWGDHNCNGCRGEQYVGVSLKIHGPAADAEAWRRQNRDRESGCQ